MVRVAVTGVGGLLGQRLVADLAEDDTVEGIVGIDVRIPPELRSDKLVLRTGDVRDPGISRLFEGVDVVCHLAFQMDPLQDEDTMRSINVEGTRNVFETAASSGSVGKVVYVSSGIVYGAHPDNDLPLTEDSPLRANPRFSYAEHKFEIERWLEGWQQEHPEVAVTVLRPSIVAGPGVENVITRQLEAPRPIVVKGHRPPMQFAHVDDVASAVAHAATSDLRGVFNVASEGWLSMDEITAIGGRRPLEVGEEVAFTVADRMWRWGLAEAPSGQVHYVMHPWVLSVDKLVATGWRPKHSNRDALAELVDEHRDWVAVAGLRVRRSRLRRSGVVIVALLALVGLRSLLTRRGDGG